MPALTPLMPGHGPAMAVAARITSIDAAAPAGGDEDVAPAEGRCVRARHRGRTGLARRTSETDSGLVELSHFSMKLQPLCGGALTVIDENETERSWLELEHEDDLDEEFEQELEPKLDDSRFPPELRKLLAEHRRTSLDRHIYFSELLRLQSELIKLQDWVAHAGLKLVVLFEGRDSAGKGGVIKRITQRVNPRTCRVVALPAPSDREKKQWYFQRYIPHLPAEGEIVLFDRSWYNRAGVERVMGFATEQQVEDFFRDVPEFERMLVRSGIILVKYWFSITDQEQQLRFLMRIHDPLKQWKLSPMDLQSRVRWERYTKAKEEMFARTNIPEAQWNIVEGNDKKRARLNCIAHLLSKVEYREVPHEPIQLPEREFNPDYERRVIPAELYVPERY